MTPRAVTTYLAELDGRLRGDLPRRDRILVEVEDHLCERVAALTTAGRDPEEAGAAAVAAFGESKALADLFNELGAAEAWETAPIRMENRALALMASVAGVVGALGLVALAGWALVDPDPIVGRASRALGLAAAAILAGGVATSLLLLSRARHLSLLRLATAGAVALVAIGIAGVIGTIELGQATGDYEWYGAAIGLAVIGEGTLAIWLLWPLLRPTTPSAKTG
jgi:hypothetical protein